MCLVCVSSDPSSARSLRVWDLPTRMFHWSLAAVVLCAIVSARIGGNAMQQHMFWGTAAMALLLFRLCWGLWGGHWSRFVHFHLSLSAWRQERRQASLGPAVVGHSFSGSWAVLALLTLLLAQVATGLVADDEIATTGPLNRWVSEAFASRATGWHKGLGQALILTMVGLHLAAIAWYTARGRRLLEPMVGGDREWAGDQDQGLPVPPSSLDGAAQRWRALVCAAVCAGLAASVWFWGPA